MSLKIQQRFYPLPNTGDPGVLRANNFRQTIPVDRSKPYDGTARIDHNFSNADRVFARVTMHQATNPVWEGNLPAFGMRDQLRQDKALTLSYTRLIGSSLVNEARFGHTYNNNPISGPLSGREVTDSLGLVGLAPGLPDVGGVFKMTFPGRVSPACRRSTRAIRDSSIVSSSSPIRFNVAARHALREGRARTSPDGLGRPHPPVESFGTVDFTGRYTGQAYADFLLGLPNTASRAFPPAAALRRRYVYDSFVQDDWKVTRNLTVNLGLRYELHPGWFERGDHLAFFDIHSGNVVVPDGALNKISPLMPAGYVNVVTAGASGCRRGR